MEHPNINFHENYKEIVKFIQGLQLAERMENDKLVINTRKTETEKHYVYHFIIPKTQSSLSWSETSDKYYATFGVYCHKQKFQVVVKTSILAAISANTRNMLTNNLTDKLRKRGFRNISYDKQLTKGTYRFPQIFVKVLVNNDKYLEDVYSLYEAFKEYNQKWHEEWIKNTNW